MSKWLLGLLIVLFVVVFDFSRVRIPAFAFASGENPLAVATYLAGGIRLPVVTLGTNLGFLLVYVLARRALGRFNRIAPLVLWIGIFWFMYGAYDTTGLEMPVLVMYAAIAAAVSTYMAVQHGLLAFVTLTYVAQVSLLTIFTVDPAEWFFAPTGLLVALIAALTIFGIRTSTDKKLLPSHS